MGGTAADSCTPPALDSGLFPCSWPQMFHHWPAAVLSLETGRSPRKKSHLATKKGGSEDGGGDAEVTNRISRQPLQRGSPRCGWQAAAMHSGRRHCLCSFCSEQASAFSVCPVLGRWGQAEGGQQLFSRSQEQAPENIPEESVSRTIHNAGLCLRLNSTTDAVSAGGSHSSITSKTL